MNNNLLSMLQLKITPRLIMALAVFISLIGIFLRVYFYIIDRSLWLDEAMLALNIVNRSFSGLITPLDYNQGAPIGFLLVEKAVISLLGNHDFTLRIIPLLAGLGSIPLIYFVSRQYGRKYSFLLPMGMVALSSALIYYSSEVKQYSGDVFVALFLMFLFAKCLESKTGPRLLVALGIVGCLSMWFSFPTLFVFVGGGITLALAYFLRKDYLRLSWLGGIVGIFSINLILIYFISLRYLAGNQDLLNYWKSGFAPFPPWSNIGWYYQAIIGLLKSPAGLPVGAITVILFILGIFSLALRRWQLMLILVSPFLTTLIAASLEKYPFSGRLILFLLPSTFLILAEGVASIWTALQRLNWLIGLLVSGILMVYLLVGPITIAYRNIISPPKRDDIKPVMSFLQKNYMSTDLIYVSYFTKPAFDYYAPFYGFYQKGYVDGFNGGCVQANYARAFDTLIGHHRVWIIFSHEGSVCPTEISLTLQYLDKIGIRKSEYIANGASGYLYDLASPP